MLIEKTENKELYEIVMEIYDTWNINGTSDFYVKIPLNDAKDNVDKFSVFMDLLSDFEKDLQITFQIELTN